jgi:hypothetical protein
MLPNRTAWLAAEEPVEVLALVVAEAVVAVVPTEAAGRQAV